jgi:hypothetical protein
MKPLLALFTGYLLVLPVLLLLGGDVPPPPAPGPPPDGRVNVATAYGANGAAGTDPRLDSYDAIQRALDENPGRTLYLPAGEYYCRHELVIRSTQALVGDGVGSAFRQRTRIAFARGCRGIVVLDDARTGGGQESSVEGVYLWGLYKTTALTPDAGPMPPCDGIVTNASISIERCRVTGFRRHGIVISAQTPETRANQWFVNNCQIDTNGLDGVGDGLHVEGGDSNAGVAFRVSSTANEGWGFWDRASLGNVYFACHARTDKAGAYSLGRGVNATFVGGCYAEADNRNSDLGDQTLWLGGTNATTVTGGQFFLAGNARMRFQSGGGSIPPLAAMGNRLLKGPTFAISNWAGGATVMASQEGSLWLGIGPGETIPPLGTPGVPRLTTWTDGVQPAIRYAVQKSGYVAPTGDVVADASGSGYGSGFVSHRTVGAAGKLTEALRLQNGRVTVGAAGLQLPALSKADRAKLRPAPGLMIFDADDRRVVVFDGDGWRALSGESR